METFLKKRISVPFTSLYLDPNNPRLAIDKPPDYSDPKRLFDKKLQAELEDRIESVYPVDDLRQAIVAQGWMPIDSIVVWDHPSLKGPYIVLEGNTRTIAL